MNNYELFILLDRCDFGEPAQEGSREVAARTMSLKRLQGYIQGLAPTVTKVIRDNYTDGLT